MNRQRWIQICPFVCLVSFLGVWFQHLYNAFVINKPLDYFQYHLSAHQNESDMNLLPMQQCHLVVGKGTSQHMFCIDLLVLTAPSKRSLVVTNLSFTLVESGGLPGTHRNVDELLVLLIALAVAERGASWLGVWQATGNYIIRFWICSYIVFEKNILNTFLTFFEGVGVEVAHVTPSALFVGVLNCEVSVFFVICKRLIIKVNSRLTSLCKKPNIYQVKLPVRFSLCLSVDGVLPIGWRCNPWLFAHALGKESFYFFPSPPHVLSTPPPAVRVHGHN